MKYGLKREGKIQENIEHPYNLLGRLDLIRSDIRCADVWKGLLREHVPNHHTQRDPHGRYVPWYVT